ncbi:MAG: hypothetical protein HY929_02520 [Euryarchaeota archaeon]|nr:hypothetical protein [Euryarchaeota archaeon]
MERSLIETFLGKTPIVKVLNFLAIHQDWDYSKTEIARHSNVGWATLFRIWSTLEEFQIVQPTRMIGRAQLYKLNKDSPVVKRFIAFADELALFNAERIIAEEAVKEEMKKPKAEKVEAARA